MILNSISIIGIDGHTYEIAPLTKCLALRFSNRLLSIHNDIPYVYWKENDLLSAVEKGMVRDDISLSFIVFDSKKLPIGLLIAYRRHYSLRHPVESVYINRLSITKRYRNLTIGTQLVEIAANYYFQLFRSIQVVSVQTNYEERNGRVISFYKNMGFVPWGPVKYQNKLDILLLKFRMTGQSQYPGIGQSAFDSSIPELERSLPIVYLASSSKEKMRQYTFLLNSQGFGLRAFPQKLTMTEPQVEGSGLDSERALVELPLKQNARFFAKSSELPVLVDDTMLFIGYFNKNPNDMWLPGPDTKRWWAALGAEGVLRLLGNTQDRFAKYVCQIGLVSGPGNVTTFRYELNGRISFKLGSFAKISGHPFTDGKFFHRIFIPEGANIPLSEMEADEFILYDYRRKCLENAIHKILAEPHLNPIQEVLF